MFLNFLLNDTYMKNDKHMEGIKNTKMKLKKQKSVEHTEGESLL